MQLHANAALSLNARRRMVLLVCEQEISVAEVAQRFTVSEKTCRKWCRRYLAEGDAGLSDRSSAPHSCPNETSADRVEAICALRRLRFTGPEISETLGMALSTVSQILKRLGMGKLGRIGLDPERRYEWALPGELIHIDIKKLGRIEGGAGKRIRQTTRGHHRIRVTDLEGKRRNMIGWDYVHIAIDDCTRLAYAEVLPDEKASTVVGFLRRAVAFFAGYGITVQRLLTDNGGAYRSTAHAIACRALGIRHRRTRPYRPQTNGKAERFIRTLLGGWAYGAIYRSSDERTHALDAWLWHYNHRRRHSALGHQPPIARLNDRNNLHGTYT
jgi:transposase InsO family protein